MQAIRNLSPVVRAVGVVGAVAVLVTGATFAALSSSVTLTNNTISTANADLLIWDGDSWEETAPGFDADNVVPGDGSEWFPFYFLNDSEVPLEISAMVPELPEMSAELEPEDVLVTFLGEACGDTVETTLAELLEGDVLLPCNPLPGGARGDAGVEGTVGNYQLMFDINPEAPKDSEASVEAFDIVFTGTQPFDDVDDIVDDVNGIDDGTDVEDDVDVIVDVDVDEEV